VPRVIADDETSGILAPQASTGLCAESMKLIVVRPLLIDGYMHPKAVTLLDNPIRQN
jgi:hypothetical protein